MKSDRMIQDDQRCGFHGDSSLINASPLTCPRVKQDPWSSWGQVVSQTTSRFGNRAALEEGSHMVPSSSRHAVRQIWPITTRDPRCIYQLASASINLSVWCVCVCVSSSSSSCLALIFPFFFWSTSSAPCPASLSHVGDK